MGIEIERKFLVKSNAWRVGAQGVTYRQGYVATQPQGTVRVRIAGAAAYLTLKSKVEHLTRSEFEYPIPVTDAQQILDHLCGTNIIEKVRYRIPVKTLVWEVDEFSGANQGLVLAEVELTSANQRITLPDWVGEEVSHDSRYFNACLARQPFSTWSAGLNARL